MNVGKYGGALGELCKPTLITWLPEVTVVPLRLTLHKLSIKFLQEGILFSRRPGGWRHLYDCKVVSHESYVHE